MVSNNIKFIVIIVLLFIIVYSLTSCYTKIIENMDTNTNTYVVGESNNFNLIDSFISFFTPEIFKISSYSGANNKLLKKNNVSPDSLVHYNSAITVANRTNLENPGQDYPICKYTEYTNTNAPRSEWNYSTVYPMCGNVPIAKWGIGPEGKTKAIGNCNYATNNPNAQDPYKYGNCNTIFTGNTIDIGSTYPVCSVQDYTPETAIKDDWNYSTVYAMCGDIPVGKWGIEGGVSLEQNIRNCNYAASNSTAQDPYRWGKCGNYMQDRPQCKFFNYSNNDKLRSDWSESGFYASCGKMPIAKAESKDSLLDENNFCKKQALQGKWGKCTDSKYNNRPMCITNDNGTISIDCNTTYDGTPLNIMNWPNNNIEQCAEYAIQLPKCSSLFNNN